MPLCPGIGEAFCSARDRIDSWGMIGGGAFRPLKMGKNRPESWKQAETCLPSFAQILSGSGPACDGAKGEHSNTYFKSCIQVEFSGDMANCR
jgi:hypothetical protein